MNRNGGGLALKPAGRRTPRGRAIAAHDPGVRGYRNLGDSTDRAQRAIAGFSLQ